MLFLIYVYDVTPGHFSVISFYMSFLILIKSIVTKEWELRLQVSPLQLLFVLDELCIFSQFTLTPLHSSQLVISACLAIAGKHLLEFPQATTYAYSVIFT